MVEIFLYPIKSKLANQYSPWLIISMLNIMAIYIMSSLQKILEASFFGIKIYW